MIHIPLPMAVCAAATEILIGSHQALELLFTISGIPGPPPEAAHHTKWKAWLFREANRPDADSLTMLGNLIGEFMDVQPANRDTREWIAQRQKLTLVLESYGLRFFRGGRVLPIGQTPPEISPFTSAVKPSTVEELIERLIAGLTSAMWPLANRRKDAVSLSFEKEADLQDLLHAMMRPWIKDIRAEDYVPSYAGHNTRIDFVLPEHRLAIEIKLVRDIHHGTKIGEELTIDIAHYRKHPDCDRLWCVVFDPKFHIKNAQGLANDLAGPNVTPHGRLDTRLFIVPQR